MTLFDRYIAVDWSASNVPVSGPDSIWIGDVARVDGRLVEAPSINARTRHAAMEILSMRLLDALAADQRVMLGFDFVFGYPRGAAAAICGTASWNALWDSLAAQIEDAADNASNRFIVAAAINQALGEHGPHYWGHPHTQHYDGLAAKRPLSAYSSIPERRLAEGFVKTTQPVWKLTGVGSVGSQSLLGVARLQALCSDPCLAAQIAVWPFETDFERQLIRPITVVEIYPSLFPVSVDDGLPRDRAQVEISCRKFAELDHAGLLGQFLSAPRGLSADERVLCIAEEGWIAGVGHTALLRELDAVA